MTCAQGLLRLLWGGGPKLECYGTVSEFKDNNVEDIVIGELVADLCSAKNKATVIAT